MLRSIDILLCRLLDLPAHDGGVSVRMQRPFAARNTIPRSGTKEVDIKPTPSSPPHPQTREKGLMAQHGAGGKIAHCVNDVLGNFL